MKNIYTLTALYLVTACGRTMDVDQRSKQEVFYQKLKFGRSVSSGSSKEGSTLGLAGDQNIFQLQLDSDQGSPTYLTFDTSKQESLQKDQLLSFAEQYVSSQAEFLGVKARELKAHISQKIDIQNRFIAINFARYINEIPVRDSILELVFVKNADNDYRLNDMFNRTHGSLYPKNSPNERIDQHLAKSELGLDELDIIKSRDVIFPKQLSPEKIELVYATEISFNNPNQEDDIVTATFENGSSALLESYTSKIYEAPQTLTATVYPRSYMDQPIQFPLVSATANDAIVNRLGQTIQKITGKVKIDLKSARVTIKRSQQTVSISTTIDDKGQVALSDTDRPAVNAFLAIQRVNNFVRQHITEADAKILNTTVSTSINVSGSCNAYYQNTTINLFSESSQCANMATVNDVIYHEWGHGLDDYTGREKTISDGAFSEGMGDIVASYISGTSNMGSGFYKNKTTGIRQLANTKSYPNDRGEVHDEGLIIGGAFWDLRVALIARYGETKGKFIAENYFFNHILTTDTYRESYQAVLRLDSAADGTSAKSANHCLITEAFAKHGLAKAEPGCIDQYDQDRADDSISVMAKDGQDSKASLVVAANADKVAGCFGTKAACLTKTNYDVLFTAEGLNSGKTVFVSNASTDMSAGKVLTILTWDVNGKFKGSRSFRFAER